MVGEKSASDRVLILVPQNPEFPGFGKDYSRDSGMEFSREIPGFGNSRDSRSSIIGIVSSDVLNQVNIHN